MRMTLNRGFRSILIKLVLLTTSTTVGLLLMEFVVREFLPFYRPATHLTFVVNSEHLIMGPPGVRMERKTPKGDFDFTVAFNGLGFRDVKDTTAGAITNIYVAGDSFSIGWGVEESERFSDVMQRQLGVPVYNISIPEDVRGYINTIKFAERHGAKIRHLVVGLCMENDIWDYTLPVPTEELYNQSQNKGGLRAVCNWFKGHSALWLFTSFQVQRFHFGRVLFEKLGVARNVEALTHKNDYSQKALTATRDELLILTTNYNAVVLIIPSRGLWFGSNVAVEGRVHNELVGLLRDAGIRLVDMRPVFEKSGRPLQYYFETDPHWNAAGHRVAGE